MVSRHDIEEVEARIRAGWHVEDDCCDNCSGQRKRYLRIENERLASLSRSQVDKTEAVRQSALSVLTQLIPVRSIPAVVDVFDVMNGIALDRVAPHISLGLC